MHFINGFVGESIQFHAIQSDLHTGLVVPAEIGGYPGFKRGLRSKIFLIHAGRFADDTEISLRGRVVVGEIPFVDVSAVPFIIAGFRSHGQIQPGAQIGIIFRNVAVFRIAVQPEFRQHIVVPGHKVDCPRESALVESEHIVLFLLGNFRQTLHQIVILDIFVPGIGILAYAQPPVFHPADRLFLRIDDLCQHPVHGALVFLNVIECGIGKHIKTVGKFNFPVLFDLAHVLRHTVDAHAALVVINLHQVMHGQRQIVLRKRHGDPVKGQHIQRDSHGSDRIQAANFCQHPAADAFREFAREPDANIIHFQSPLALMV